VLVCSFSAQLQYYKPFVAEAVDDHLHIHCPNSVFNFSTGRQHLVHFSTQAQVRLSEQWNNGVKKDSGSRTGKERLLVGGSVCLCVCVECLYLMASAATGSPWVSGQSMPLGTPLSHIEV
jgi:hypothetical protein